MSKKILLSCIIFLTLGICFFSYDSIRQKNTNTLTPTPNKLERQKSDEVYVYETDAESADECTSYETYDPEKSVCTYECSGDECDTIAAGIDEEMAGWYDDDGVEDGKNIQSTHESPLKENDDSLRAEYTVTKGEKITLKTGEKNPNDAEIWNLISKISPDWLSDGYIDTFQVFENADDDTLAFVDDEDGDGKWRVAVNAANFSEGSEKEKNLTIVHELGHIITLNRTQINSKKSAPECPLAHIDEGCPESKSYIAGFVKLFWTPSDIAESEKENSKLYQKKSTNFITEYASTNFTEDIAESFAYFVFGEQNTKNTTIADKKQQYFAQFPELIKTREEMRSGVKSNIIRARKMAKTSF